MTAPTLLVGQRVRVVRADGPVNHEGLVGRIVDHVDRGRSFLVRFDRNFERWIPAANLAAEPRDIEHEGYPEHLDAIERRVIVAGRRAPVELIDPSETGIDFAGTVRTGRVAYVEKTAS